MDGMRDIGILFTEQKLVEGKKIMIAREASFVHRRGITKKDLELMKEHFDNKDLGLDVYFDFNHDETQPAGWIKSLEYGETKVDGKTLSALFAVPEWNPDGQEAIKGGKYKYVSPEIFWEWIHPENGKKFKSVLRSVAILNRPQIPGQPSIKFSETIAGSDEEVVNQEDNKSIKEETMFKKLKEFAAKIFGEKFAAEEVTEEQIVEAIQGKFTADAEALKTKDEELKALQVKFTSLEEEKGDVATFKAQLEKVEGEQKKEKVTRLVEKCVDKKLPPAQANGWFKELAEKDIELAEKTFKDLPDMITDKKPESEINGGAIPDDVKGISTMREEMAKSRGVKFADVSYREAYDAFYDKAAQKKDDKGGE